METGTIRPRCHRDLLWYTQPGREWIEALALGNGRIGAMVRGGALEEQIQVDESTFWSGAPSGENNRAGTKALIEKLRALLIERKFAEADRLGQELVGNKNNYGTNLPVGNLKLQLQTAAGQAVREEETVYHYRSLHLAEGVSETVFSCRGAVFRREVWVSNPAQIFCLKFVGEVPFSLKIRFDGIGNDTVICGSLDREEQTGGERYRIRGNARETLHSDGSCGVHLEGTLGVVCDGGSIWEQGAVLVKDTSELILYLDLETDMQQADPGARADARVTAAMRGAMAAAREAGVGSTAGALPGKTRAAEAYDCQKAAHIRDVRALYERMDLKLGREGREALPTDVRIRQMAQGVSDPALLAQLFQFGRYLLIASSRADSPLPTHMGGIWNDGIYCNMDCTQDMHIDMNLQMQYWPAAQCSLPELQEPLFGYLEKVLVPSGTKTAREAYGARGWTAHLVTNPWGFTSLGWAYNWGVWSLGGVWLALLLWDSYTYTADLDFLAGRAYPILRGAAEFVLDYVFYDPVSGYYMSGPSYSPENRFAWEGKEYVLSLSATCDIVLIRELLQVMEKVRRLLGLEEDAFDEQMRTVLAKLPPYQIGRQGQIQEWFYDFDEPDPGHRHTSHLLGLYPFRQIEKEKTPALAAGARKAIERRYESFEVTSWGYAMLIGYYARLQDGEAALRMLQDTVEKIVKPSMASVMSDEDSMWCATWELDGNTGLTAGIGEMLLQSSEETVWILPALPKAWEEGSLRGISLRGGHRADLCWKEGRLTELYVDCGSEEEKVFCYQGQQRKICLKTGERIRIDGF